MTGATSEHLHAGAGVLASASMSKQFFFASFTGGFARA